MIDVLSGILPVRKPTFPPTFALKSSLYQDRLGTNIGKTQEKNTIVHAGGGAGDVRRYGVGGSGWLSSQGDGAPLHGAGACDAPRVTTRG